MARHPAPHCSGNGGPVLPAAPSRALPLRRRTRSHGQRSCCHIAASFKADPDNPRPAFRARATGRERALAPLSPGAAPGGTGTASPGGSGPRSARSPPARDTARHEANEIGGDTAAPAAASGQRSGSYSAGGRGTGTRYWGVQARVLRRGAEQNHLGVDAAQGGTELLPRGAVLALEEALGQGGVAAEAVQEPLLALRREDSAVAGDPSTRDGWRLREESNWGRRGGGWLRCSAEHFVFRTEPNGQL